MPSTWSLKVALAVTVAILGCLTGPSQSVVIPLTNQPISHGGPSSQAAPGNSRNSNAAPASSFPAHDPFGRAKAYPGVAPLASSQPDRSGKRQTLQFTFQPALAQNYTPTSTSAAAAPAVLPTLKAAYTPPEPVSLATDPNRIIINPANIQWTAPDVPDEVSKAIIEQLRQKLGAEPVPLGELNNRLITFTTALPGVIINRTMITNVQETVLEEANNKSTRTMTSYKQGPPLNYQISTSSKSNAYDGHPSKTYVTYEQTTPINSLAYNPAAVYDSSRSAASSPPQYNTGNDYQKSYSEQQYSYQVPSESSYQTNYYQPPPPQPQQQSYSKPPAQQGYQQDSPAYQAPAPKAYQKAPESPAAYQKPQPKPQPQYQSPPPPPPPKAPEYPKPKAAEPYQPPKTPESYHPQQQQKKQQSYAPEENVKIIYKYIEVCNPEPYQKQSKSPPPKPYSPAQKPAAPAGQQYPNQKQANPYIEAALNQASQYPSTPEPLNLDLASTTNEAAGSAQDSQATLASVYGEIHRRMAELEQLQRYVGQIQAEAQQAAYVPIAIPPIYLPPMPTLSYGAASLPASYPEAQAVPSSYYSPPISAVPNYAQPPPPPPPPKPVAPYSLPAPPAPAKPEYKQQQPQPSYQAAPKPSYQGEPKPSYNSQPYSGQQMTVQYQKTVEKVSSNSTSPAY